MAIDPTINKKFVVAPKNLVNAKSISNSEKFVRQLLVTIVGDWSLLITQSNNWKFSITQVGDQMFWALPKNI